MTSPTKRPAEAMVRAILQGVLGAASFGAGVAAVFTTDNGAGAVTLLLVGGVLLFLLLTDLDIRSMEWGGAKLTLSRKASELNAMADEAASRGDLAQAKHLRERAQDLLEAMRPTATQYHQIRGSMPSGPDRTRLLEQVAADARQQAATRSFVKEDVRQWLLGRNEGERITALAIMQARPELRDFDVMLATIKRSRSSFELPRSVSRFDDAQRTHPGSRTPATRSDRACKGRRLDRQGHGPLVSQRDHPGEPSGIDRGCGRSHRFERQLHHAPTDRRGFVAPGCP